MFDIIFVCSRGRPVVELMNKRRSIKMSGETGDVIRYVSSQQFSSDLSVYIL